jgi:phosphatidylglycerol:prolipoprotein diacylglycerol transferase
MSLPKLTWDVDPVFLHIPKTLVIGVAGAIALYSLFQASRRKGGDHLSTAALFGALALIAWKFMGDSLELRYYSLLFVAVFLGGYSLLKWQIVRGGGEGDDAGEFIVYGVLGVLVGARLGHVLFYDLEHALRDPVWVFKIWTGGLASHGAVIGLIIAMWIYTKRRGIAFLEGADRFSFAATLGATLVRVGNLMNSEIVGRKTDQSWGFQFPRFDNRVPAAEVPYRYPTQLAEIALGVLVMAALYFIDKKLGKERRPRGALIASFFLIYFSGRFFIEFYKEFEGPVESGSPVTMGQILSLPGVLLGAYGLFWAFKKRLPVGWPVPAGAPSLRGRSRDADDDDDETEREEAQARKKKRKAEKREAEKRAAEEREEAERKEQAERDDEAETETRDDDSERDDRDDDDDDRDDDDDDRDDDDRDDDDRDDDDRDDDDRDDDEDEPKKPAKDVDPDVAAEFDEKGSLKRRRNPNDG